MCKQLDEYIKVKRTRLFNRADTPPGQPEEFPLYLLFIYYIFIRNWQTTWHRDFTKPIIRLRQLFIFLFVPYLEESNPEMRTKIK